MTARHKYRNDDGDLELVPTVLRWDYTAAAKAEEGEAGTYEIVVDDPDMTLDFVGHRRWIIYEDESVDANEIVVDGITQAVRIGHKGGSITEPGGRVWVIEVADLNTLWTYRVMTGSDAKRPAETDVERMTALANSEEMGYFDDLSLLSSGSPVDMDKADVRGQTTGQVADSCAQESGKNWWIASTGTVGEIGADIFLFYGPDNEDSYLSPLALSNDPSELDMHDVDTGAASIYPLGADTELRRDYARQYSGAYGEYQKGAKYIPDTENPYAPDITLSGRDIVYPAPEITSATRMKSRLLRVLRDHATPDEVISTTVTLPASRVTQIRAGMLIVVRATHEPGYEGHQYLRVMSAMPTPVGAKYEVKLELQGPGTFAPLQTVTLVATNTVLEDAARNALDSASGLTFQAGSVWRYTLINSQHATAAWTDALALSWTSDGAHSPYVVVRGWGISVWYAAPGGYPHGTLNGTPTDAPDQGVPSITTHPPFADETNTFVVTDDTTIGGGGFVLYAGANYEPAFVSVDEQWTCILERLS